MIFGSDKQSATVFLSLGCAIACLGLTACSSQNSSRYGGGGVSADCGVTVPCQRPIPPALPPALPPAQFIQSQQFLVTQPVAAAPLPAPVAAAPEPYIEPYVEPYVAPYVAPPPTYEPYIEAGPILEPLHTHYRDLPAVDDDRLYANDCPAGQIPSYGGGECVSLTPGRK